MPDRRTQRVVDINGMPSQLRLSVGGGGARHRVPVVRSHVGPGCSASQGIVSANLGSTQPLPFRFMGKLHVIA